MCLQKFNLKWIQSNPCTYEINCDSKGPVGHDQEWVKITSQAQKWVLKQVSKDMMYTWVIDIYCLIIADVGSSIIALGWEINFGLIRV